MLYLNPKNLSSDPTLDHAVRTRPNNKVEQLIHPAEMLRAIPNTAETRRWATKLEPTNAESSRGNVAGARHRGRDNRVMAYGFR